MANRYFTEEQLKRLEENKFVKKVSIKAITYTDEFKIHFLEMHALGYGPTQIFADAGFDVTVLGVDRVKMASRRWRGLENRIEGVTDTRTTNSGRTSGTLPKDLTLEEKYEKALAKIKNLEHTVELLKKKRNKKMTYEDKFRLIKTLATKYNYNIKMLCKLNELSESGYYAYLKRLPKIEIREEKDKEDFEWIQKAFKFKNRAKGARQIKMTLFTHFNMTMNLKKIRRLMKKFNVVCSIRKPKPHKKMLKAQQTNKIHDNIVNRNFDTGVPGKVILTDITYIKMASGHAYLSAIKDGCTKEILAYKLSNSLMQDFVLETVNDLIHNHNLPKYTIINSDQGCHYTSIAYQSLLRKLGLIQSMSRKGNCWDNAPIESFFGHMKDELNITKNMNFEELQKEIDDYMDYYNNYRCQWNLNRLTPVAYRNMLYENNTCRV